MSPTMPRSVPTSNLVGFSQSTAIMAFVANKPLHLGGAFAIR